MKYQDSCYEAGVYVGLVFTKGSFAVVAVHLMLDYIRLESPMTDTVRMNAVIFTVPQSREKPLYSCFSARILAPHAANRWYR